MKSITFARLNLKLTFLVFLTLASQRQAAYSQDFADETRPIKVGFCRWPAPVQTATYEHRSGRIVALGTEGRIDQFSVEAMLDGSPIEPVASTHLKVQSEFVVPVTYDGQPAIAASPKEELAIHVIDCDSGKLIHQTQAVNVGIRGLWCAPSSTGSHVHACTAYTSGQRELLAVDLKSSAIQKLKDIRANQFQISRNGRQIYCSEDMPGTINYVEYDLQSKFTVSPIGPSRRSTDRTDKNYFPLSQQLTQSTEAVGQYLERRSMNYLVFNEDDENLYFGNQHYVTNPLETRTPLPFAPLANSQTHRLGAGIKLTDSYVRIVLFETTRHEVLFEAPLPESMIEHPRPSRFFVTFDDVRGILLVLNADGICVIDLKQIQPVLDDLKRPPSFPRTLEVGKSYELPLTTDTLTRLAVHQVPANVKVLPDRLQWTPEIENVGRNTFHFMQTSRDGRKAILKCNSYVTMPSIPSPHWVREILPIPGKRELIVVGYSDEKSPKDLHLTILNPDTFSFGASIHLTADAAVFATLKGVLVRYGNGKVDLHDLDDLKLLKTAVIQPATRPSMNPFSRRAPSAEDLNLDALVALKAIKEGDLVQAGKSIEGGYVADSILWTEDRKHRKLLLPTVEQTYFSASDFGPYEPTIGYYFDKLRYIPMSHQDNHPLNSLKENGSPWSTSFQNNNGSVELEFWDSSLGSRVSTLRFGKSKHDRPGSSKLVVFCGDSFVVQFGGELYKLPIPQSKSLPFRIEPVQSHLAIHPKNPTRVRYQANGAVRYEMEIRPISSNPTILVSNDGVFTIDPKTVIRRDVPLNPGADNNPQLREDAKIRKAAEERVFFAQTGQELKGTMTEFHVRVRATNQQGAIALLTHRYFIDSAGKEIRGFQTKESSNTPLSNQTEPNEMTIDKDAAQSADSMVRKFTNQSGKVIEAKFSGVEKDVALLEVKGKLFRVPINQLSDEDQTWIKENATK